MDRASILTTLTAMRRQIDTIEAALSGEQAPLIDVDLIAIAEAARALGRSKEAVRKWANRSGLAVRVRGRVHVRRGDLKAYLRGD